MTTGLEIFEIDEPVAARDGGRKSPLMGRFVVTVLLAAMVMSVGVAITRIAAVLAPSATGTEEPARGPGADALDETGLGLLRLGMTTAEYRGLGPDSGSGRSSRLVAVDYAHSCAQYEAVSPSSGDVVWVWLRENVVVTVGVEITPDHLAGTARTPGTAVFGARLGGPMAAVAQLPQRWSWDSRGSVRLARRSTDEGGVLLADIDGDGLLDYASTATAGADVCQVDPRRSPELQTAVPGTATIVGESLGGVSLGLHADRVTAVEGWFELGSAQRSCRRFVSGHGAVAETSDGRVVSLSADRLSEGPAVGDGLVATLETLGLGASARDMATSDMSAGRPVVRQQFVLPDGRWIALDSATPYQLHDALDRSYPVGEPTIRAIVVGRPCAPRRT